MADVVESTRLDELLDEYGGYAEDIKLGRVYGTCLVGEFMTLLRAARLSQAGAGGGVVDVEDVRSQAEMLLLAIRELDPTSELEVRVNDILAALAPSPSANDLEGLNAAYLRGDIGSAEYGKRLRAIPGYVVQATSQATPVQPTASVEAVAEAYSDGQRDALAEATWMHSKAWQDAVLMLVYYTDLDKRDARVTKAQAEKGRAQAWAHCLNLASTKTAEDIASLTPAPTQGDGA